eukprot:2223170-Amphidinium_carterae.1
MEGVEWATGSSLKIWRCVGHSNRYFKYCFFWALGAMLSTWLHEHMNASYTHRWPYAVMFNIPSGAQQTEHESRDIEHFVNWPLARDPGVEYNEVALSLKPVVCARATLASLAKLLQLRSLRQLSVSEEQAEAGTLRM